MSRSRNRVAILGAMALGLLLIGCLHRPEAGLGEGEGGGISRCRTIAEEIDFRDRIGTLSRIMEAYRYRCYETVIHLGTRVQEKYRFKTFSLLKETGNIFLPDGAVVDYILESYERGFLAFLLSASYFQLGRPEASQIELRRMDHEVIAQLYNYGEDPVNILLGAVLWEKHGDTGESRVDWNRIEGQEGVDPGIRSRARVRMNAIDQEEALSRDWKVYAIGRLPEADWGFKFMDSTNGYFTVEPQSEFLPDCASETGFRISTRSWFEKIGMRHNNRYHPLLNAQSWLRLPIGILYGITTFASGAGIAVSGCAVDATGDLQGVLCRVSIEGGLILMSQSPKVLRYTLKPDLRHWENLPSGFLLTTVGAEGEKCAVGLSRSGADHPDAIYPLLN